MTQYRAIVSITFDEEDLATLARALGLDFTPNATDSLNGALDNLELGSGWIEQLYADGQPTIARIGDGMTVEVSDH